MELTPDQLTKLQSIGLSSRSKPPANKSYNLIPLLSFTGITLVTSAGLIYLKTQSLSAPVTNAGNPQPQAAAIPTPTQVPKSIQHFLLSSQTSFSQALSLTQAKSTDSSSLINHLNSAILAASQAIELFPTDPRGYEQRGRIYLSLIDSRPQYLSFAISDYSLALKHNPTSATNAHTLASLFARQGNSTSTLHYLSLALSLDPTNPQNFYDLARIQQQTGLIPQALATYQRLLPLVTDPNQKQQLENETLALKQLASQSPSVPTRPPFATPTFSSPLLQAQLLPLANSNNVIVASPESAAKSALLSEKSNSNSLSGQSVLKAGQTSQVISTTQLTQTSQVYLTITQGGKNQTLEVLSKTAASFTIGLPAPISEDLEYRWWIVN